MCFILIIIIVFVKKINNKHKKSHCKNYNVNNASVYFMIYILEIILLFVNYLFCVIYDYDA